MQHYRKLKPASWCALKSHFLLGIAVTIFTYYAIGGNDYCVIGLIGKYLNFSYRERTISSLLCHLRFEILILEVKEKPLSLLADLPSLALPFPSTQLYR